MKLNLKPKGITQEELVYGALDHLGGRARTEQIKIVAMRHGVSCADRYLRWLADKGLVKSWKVDGDHTKTWKIIGKRPIFKRNGWR